MYSATKMNRPTAGCLSVPLFNQKKRSRLPLTSNPSENEFSLSNEYRHSPASSNSTSGTSGYYQSQPADQLKSNQWNRQGNPQSHQQYGNNRPAPGPAPTVRPLTPLPHPYQVGNSPQTRQPSNPVGRQQDSRTNPNPRQSDYQPFYSCDGSAQSKPVLPSGSSKMTQQQLPYRPTPQANTSKQYLTQQSRPLPPPSQPPPSRSAVPVPQPQTSSWKFKGTKTSEPQTSPIDDKSTYHTQPVLQTQQTSVGFEVKPATENSLRILTSRIDGMRHWSQFINKAQCLFEIFATLDSAVTLGSYGAKNFLMRDGKEVMSCVFYENLPAALRDAQLCHLSQQEQELPRLIRGHVHRCVGNYDGTKDTLVCVSVRAGRDSEQRNAQEAVRACEAEMRALTQPHNEV